MLDIFKERAVQILNLKNYPSKKQEEWRYSDLSLLNDNSNKMDINNTTSISPDKSNYYIVFTDGLLDKKKSNLPEKTIQLYDTKDQICLDALSKFDLQNGFDNKYHILQNYSQIKYAVLFEINETLDKPLKIYYLNSKNSHCSIFIKIKKGVSIKLYEEFIQSKNTGYTNNQVTKLELDKNASCKHFKQHNFTNDAELLYSSEITCNKNAQYQNYVVNVECKSYRQDIECKLQDENASCYFYGVNIGKKQQKYDIILNVKHLASNTKTIQHYNQILGKKSQGSFYSRVEIPAMLNNIEAHQLNKNLLLDETAQAFSRPELDIHSDDVVCSHGATIGNIDRDSIDYLNSRGINSVEAQKLIIEGFIKTVFENKGLDQQDYKMLNDQIAKHIK